MLATDNAILKRFEKRLEKNRPERFDILPILEWRFDAYHSDEEFQGIISHGILLCREQGWEQAMDYLGKELRPHNELSKERALWYYLNEVI